MLITPLWGDRHRQTDNLVERHTAVLCIYSERSDVVETPRPPLCYLLFAHCSSVFNVQIKVRPDTHHTGQTRTFLRDIMIQYIHDADQHTTSATAAPRRESARSPDHAPAWHVRRVALNHAPHATLRRPHHHFTTGFASRPHS
eukprot:scaffold67804_cov89-Phaeocystis_antarctica.AAC.1